MTDSTPHRPLSVTLLAWMAFIVTIVNFLRLGLSLYNWEFLEGLLPSAVSLPLFPAYLALTGLVWGSVWLPLAWGIWRGKLWAPHFTLAALLAYTIYYWLDRILLTGDLRQNLNWPFSLGLNLLILLWSLWILTRPRAKIFFGEVHERGTRQPERN